MAYALLRRPVTHPRLVAFFAGHTLELVEIAFGPLSDLSIEAGTDNFRRAQAMLGASLTIDGQALGLEGLRALPGRLGPALSELMIEVARLHREDDTPPEDDDEDEDDATATNGAGGAAPGEALRA